MPETLGAQVGIAADPRLRDRNGGLAACRLTPDHLHPALSGCISPRPARLARLGAAFLAPLVLALTRRGHLIAE